MYFLLSTCTCLCPSLHLGHTMLKQIFMKDNMTNVEWQHCNMKPYSRPKSSCPNYIIMHQIRGSGNVYKKVLHSLTLAQPVLRTKWLKIICNYCLLLSSCETDLCIKTSMLALSRLNNGVSDIYIDVVGIDVVRVRNVRAIKNNSWVII